MIDLKVKTINEKAVIPSYTHDGDAGLDLFSVEYAEIFPNESKLIRTGIIIELPENTEAQIRPRSGLALKHQITVLNSPGTIDSGYRGEIGVILINHGKNSFIVEIGMKIAQLVVKPTFKVNTIKTTVISDSSRGQGGFGSTGK